MRQRHDLDRLWRRAFKAVPASIDGGTPPPFPETCPYTLDQILIEEA
jgi:hypothetical protein